MPVQEPETPTRSKPRFIDKEWLRQKLAEHDARTGFIPVPGATAEMAQQLQAEHLRAQGIDPDTIMYLQDYED